jgi:hypothetical protein
VPRSHIRQVEIFSAGADVVRELGVDALSGAEVARRLRVPATTLERRVGQSLLLAGTIDHIVATRPAILTQLVGDARLGLWATQTRSWMAGFPGLAKYLTQCGGEMPVVQELLAGLAWEYAAGGLTWREGLVNAGQLWQYLLLAVTTEEQVSAATVGWSRLARDAGRWPNLARLIGMRICGVQVVGPTGHWPSLIGRIVAPIVTMEP